MVLFRGHVDFSGVEQIDPKFIIGENFVTSIWKFLCESMLCTVYAYIFIVLEIQKIQDDFQPNYKKSF